MSAVEIRDFRDARRHELGIESDLEGVSGDESLRERPSPKFPDVAGRVEAPASTRRQADGAQAGRQLFGEYAWVALCIRC